MPYSIRILLESSLRNCDNFHVKESDVEKVSSWATSSNEQVDISYKPARVLLQDFTGGPCLVDLASMRDIISEKGGNPKRINPLIPTDLVVDHSIISEYAREKEALQKNMDLEFERNSERFKLFKWGQLQFDNISIIPPGSGIVHQVNLEYLARVVFEKNGLLYPDSCVGADSHTTMINGLGIVGWGVGGIEAESSMLGQAISMVLPQVIGVRLEGKLSELTTATDMVLYITQLLRQKKVVGKFVEFFGPGMRSLSLADRATVSNMCPEYGATVGFFPVDERTLEYLSQTGRTKNKIELIETYLRKNNLFYSSDSPDSVYSEAPLVVDLSKIQPSISGPKRPQDLVLLTDAKKDFEAALTNQVGFKGFGLSSEEASASTEFEFKGEKYTFNHGSIVISAITSCTNTSNPDVMISAGLLAKAAVEKGLKVKPYIKTSLAPGSGVVTKYLENSKVLPYLEELGFNIVGYGCTTCIGNVGDIPKEVADVINSKDFVAASVLSGNRNFEGRIHPQSRANYLASPPLCVAYALAGTVNIDFSTEPIGKDNEGNNVFLADIWPTKEEIEANVKEHIKPEMFIETYERVVKGTEAWQQLEVSESLLFNWDPKSTYVKPAPFFELLRSGKVQGAPIKGANVLMYFGDSITTDHISPAGSIAKNSPAAQYLNDNGIEKKDFNSYGARRGNFEVMVRGTFANVRIVNKLVEGQGAKTRHVPSGEVSSVYDVAVKYMTDEVPTIILAGKEYGSGSSRDWAGKGPLLLGVKAVIAESYERIHRSNLVGMGVLPLQFIEGESASSLKLTGEEKYNILLPEVLGLNQEITITTDCGNSFKVITRIDTEPEVEYYKCGGLLVYVLKQLMN